MRGDASGHLADFAQYLFAHGRTSVLQDSTPMLIPLRQPFWSNSLALTRRRRSHNAGSTIRTALSTSCALYPLTFKALASKSPCCLSHFSQSKIRQTKAQF
jgi:hypothetical protein